jgi:2-desacetyl-2-hydroxyethyl bacteriochlorophyllide A dehydrogenase
MKRRAVVFQAPFRVRVNTEALPVPRPCEVIVRCALSSISAGTELLVYRGQMPNGLPLDASLPALDGAFRYPLRYGYAAVGTVCAAGNRVAQTSIGRRVFCFHPHASYIAADPAGLVPIPDDVDFRDAVFLANMETAVTLVMDGLPAIGEHAVVFGQGVVGLLATGLLAQFPLAALFAVEPLVRRREASVRAGAHAAFDPAAQPSVTERLRDITAGSMADLVFELSGYPPALDAAIAAAGFGARIVIGSWYGSKPVAVNLGGAFHRSRLRLIGSQVSSLPPKFLPRWTRPRRFSVAWDMIRRTRPSRLITHDLPVERAAEAYDLLDRRPEDVLQVVFTYHDRK